VALAAPADAVFKAAAADEHVAADGVLRVLDEDGRLIAASEADLLSRIEVELVITAQPGVDVRKLPSAALGGPSVHIDSGGFGERVELGGGVVQWRYAASGTPVSVGAIEPPVFAVHYEGGAGELDAPGLLEVSFASARIRVAESAPGARAGDEPSSTRGAAPAWDTWWWLLWIAAGLVGAAAVVIGLVVLARRLLTERAPAPSAGPPADVAALGRLVALERSGMLERGEHDQLATEVADVLRWYIGERFGLRAPEMTTPEFLRSARREPALKHESPVVGAFLERCDMIKFAAAAASRDEAERAIDLARGFIERSGSGAPTAGDDARGGGDGGTDIAQGAARAARDRGEGGTADGTNQERGVRERAEV
jgi:hypothetical protein